MLAADVDRLPMHVLGTPQCEVNHSRRDRRVGHLVDQDEAPEVAVLGVRASTMDIGGRYAGTVSGAMNMMGSVAGALSVTVVGYLLAWTSGNWTLTFYISSGIYFIGAFCWLFLDSHSPVERTAAV